MILQPARQLKHRAARLWWIRKRRWEAALTAAYEEHRPRAFDSDRYYNTFLQYTVPPESIDPQTTVPRIVWCIWSGTNEMSENRLRGLESIRHFNAGSEVILVTPDNLGDFVLPSAPLHPIYENLSLVHRSDYLRGYLLHHHGGAYADIKVQRSSIADAIDELNSIPELWFVGAPKPEVPPRIGGEPRVERDTRIQFRRTPSGASYAARAGTALTASWRAEVERRCDYFLSLVNRYPGETWGLLNGNPTDTQYPIRWNELQAEVLDPICLKYRHQLRLDPKYLPHLDNHR